MPEPIIEVRNLSKRYRLGDFGRHTFREQLDRWWNRLLKKNAGAPLSNGRFSFNGAGAKDFWALRDVSFSIERGEVVGVIGRNGAGKSTLLKILSRITEPTSGDALIRGRIASLLEVGTGFHPELTGRENVYLNGAILGMKRREIQGKFDEIVDFAEMADFIDTPVKRYSSGMYVKLAFAVAAYLDPEILIVDEVLSVGDAQFQKKCLGKMNSIAREGRTILFVSHNMGMITSLCSRGILLESGRLILNAPANEAVMGYYTRGHLSPASVDFARMGVRVGDDYAQLLECYIKNPDGEVTPNHDINNAVIIGLRYRILRQKRFDRAFPYAQINLHASGGALIFQSMAPTGGMEDCPPGDYVAECEIPRNFLNNEMYYISVAMATCDSGVNVHFHEINALCFQVTERLEASLYARRNGFSGPIAGAIRPDLKWRVEKTETSRLNNPRESAGLLA